jgi:hypothetical protein
MVDMATRRARAALELFTETLRQSPEYTQGIALWKQVRVR